MAAPLDEKARDAALAAWFANTAQGWHAAMEAAIRAYLAASPSPSEMDLVQIDATDRDMIASGDRIGAKLVRQLLAHHDQAQSALVAMRAERDAAGRTAQWHAFSKVLDFINTLEEKVVAKKEIYAAVMDMRPAPHDDIRADLADFDTLGRHLREVNKAYEAAESQILRLTEENEALLRKVNAYAYQRDCAREERDKAERRSENFWRPQKEAAEARIKALEEAQAEGVDHVETLSELLKIIKEHWIDYDHVFSIAVDEADKFVAASALKENAL